MSGDASAEEDASILEELAMISRINHPQSSNDEQEQDEERDSFHLEDMPSPLSLPISATSTTSSGICHHPNAGGIGGVGLTGTGSSIQVHRPIPMLSRVGGQHPRLQALQASSGQCSLPVSSSTGCDPATGLTLDTSSSVASNGKQGMSRSISDSTLRRAALHLNLNQSVLPSFTSLQQFKVYFFKKGIFQKNKSEYKNSLLKADRGNIHSSI